MPRILVADDNPLSLRFFAEALRGLGHQCDCAEDGAQALALANERRYDALLLDLDMPHLSGTQVYARLRASTTAASAGARLVATSAELDAVRRTALVAQGFDAVLGKPATLAELDDLLRALLAPRSRVAETRAVYATGSGLLDDAAAITACGDIAVVASLRAMFVDELDTLSDELDGFLARDDDAGLADRLHRLRASCGFCGAGRLDEAARSLRRVLGTSVQGAAMQELRSTAAATLAALRGQL
ncbi:Hpt domain-containing response regulator [Tahibacter soli]|uniref:Response regulator n=1 Tax=Tahibacter soli TaxID=2983605 RepID=A0A9X3YH33_9GAMM|nr:response regulator [Tahibacter soli]MDC8012141.1 response regulator [Tahibacter soli]